MRNIVIFKAGMDAVGKVAGASSSSSDRGLYFPEVKVMVCRGSSSSGSSLKGKEQLRAARTRARNNVIFKAAMDAVGSVEGGFRPYQASGMSRDNPYCRREQAMLVMGTWSLEPRRVETMDSFTYKARGR